VGISRDNFRRPRLGSNQRLRNLVSGCVVTQTPDAAAVAVEAAMQPATLEARDIAIPSGGQPGALDPAKAMPKAAGFIPVQ